MDFTAIINALVKFIETILGKEFPAIVDLLASFKPADKEEA